MLYALTIALALAEENAPDWPVVRPGGVIFAHYGYDLTEGADGYNAFALDRVYVRVSADLAPRLAALVTLDADRLKATDASGAPLDTKYRVFVKHAYLEVKEIAPGVLLRAGMVDTPYTILYDSFWGHRYVAASFTNAQGLLETADLGIGAWGEHADKRVS